MKLNNEKEFRRIPGLRWRLDEDGCAIATCVRGTLRNDHLYFHGLNTLGIYYQRRTRRGAEAARRFWRQEIIWTGGSDTRDIPGDFDGIVLFDPVDDTIPPQFLRSSRRGFAKKAVT